MDSNIAVNFLNLILFLVEKPVMIEKLQSICEDAFNEWGKNYNNN